MNLIFMDDPDHQTPTLSSYPSNIKKLIFIHARIANPKEQLMSMVL